MQLKSRQNKAFCRVFSNVGNGDIEIDKKLPTADKIS